jgi:WD40 repeat protein
MQTFTAHDSDVKSIAVDESEEFFVTGSIDGDIKVSPVPRFHLAYFLTKTLFLM